MAFYVVSDANLQGIANKIRAKGETSAPLAFPTGYENAIDAIPLKQVASWHQCPEAVRHYLAYIAAHPYSDSDYTTTQILNYAPSTADQANSKPVGYTVDGVTFYDNEPLVAEPFSTANKAGTLTALDKLRWYNTTCAPASANDHYGLGYNCRDLGGWACDSGTVRYGMLVRSGELNPVDKELMVDTVGIKTEINLLPYNMQNDTHESVWGIERVANPSNSDFMYNISANLDQWKLYLGALFRSTAESKGVIFHCGAGADKTGTLAVMVMGMLGCSLSDIDADYELTTFSAYSDWRNRTFISYQNLINAIQAFPLESGLTDSFQNHCVSFALSLGFTADEINAFRVACIDGTPSTITPNLDSYTVIKNGSNVAFSNSVSAVDEYQGYEVEITPDIGYVIESVSVTMGGVDVSSYFRGTRTNLNRYVTLNLTNCTIDNNSTAAMDGQSYLANVTASAGYTLEGATVLITMGGVDVSTFYSNGKIAIPNVTGNLVITVTAAASAPTNVFPNQFLDTDGVTVYNGGLGYKNNYRFRGTLAEDANSNSCVSGYLDVSGYTTLTISGCVNRGGTSGYNLVCYDSSYAALSNETTEIGATYAASNNPNGTWTIPSGVKYIRFSASNNPAAVVYLS